MTPIPTYDDAERQAIYRALVTMAVALTRAGWPVIIDATGHRREWRDLARASIADFAEIQLVCPLDVALARERIRPPGYHPRGVYAHARRPGATVPGVNVPYEPAVAPELTIDTTRETVEAAAARVVGLTRMLARRPAPPAGGVGWTIWIAGPPGSGKTTIVSAVYERLHGRGAPAAILQPVEIAAAIVPGGHPSPKERGIITRAVVQTAKLLSEAGVAVLVDGAWPSGDGRRLAREILGHFAEVELLCPPEVCRTRERAVRWNLVPCPAAVRPMAPPDLGLDYEPAVAPDLVLYTDMLDERAAADEVLRLANRLERAARERRLPCA